MKQRKEFIIHTTSVVASIGQFTYIQASTCKQKGHETIIADGVRIDLPGNIKKIVEREIKKLDK